MELEGGGTTRERTAELLQKAINSGSAWSLQGSYGRSMMQAIDAGECMLGPRAARDTIGNRIPARTEVEDGTRGSRQYVVDRMGEDWAQMLEAMDPPKPSVRP